MNTYNIAVIFSPVFFRPEIYSIEDLMYSKDLVNILKLILLNEKEMFKEEE